MSKFRAIELAISQATRQRDAVARQHAQAIGTLQHAKDQLEQLTSYSSDTDARWIGGHAFDLSVEMVKHHYQFTDRLQNAVHMQQGVISNLERQRAAVHQRLLQAEYRLAGLEEVLKNSRAALSLLEQRREQRATDEFAAQRHQRRRAEQTLEDLNHAY